MMDRGEGAGGLTRGILPPADLDELLDVGDFARHDGRAVGERLILGCR